MKVRTALAAAALSATTITIPAVAASPAQACEQLTYQYDVAGETVTLYRWVGGDERATLRPGDVFNTGFSPDATGWLIGNAYDSHGGFIGRGFVLRQWISYNGTAFC